MRVQVKRTSYFDLDENDDVTSVLNDESADHEEKVKTIIYSYSQLPGPFRQYHDVFVFNDEGQLIFSGGEGV